MYERFFGFEETPFRLTPDPRYLFLSEKHKEALGHLAYGLEEGAGFVAITGEIGAGKTTLLRSFLSDPPAQTRYAYILNPVLSGVELLEEINHELGVAEKGTQRELLGALNEFLLHQKAAGNQVVLIIDEAQALGGAILEQLRMLSNFETETAKLLQIVLVGQPELRDLLARPDLEQLEQRITVRWHLGPLDREETARYVKHRLSTASGGRARRIFTTGALARIYAYTGGVPRRINVVCHRALLVAYARDSTSVTRSIVRQAIEEIEAPRRSGAAPARWTTARLAAAAALLILTASLGGLAAWQWAPRPGFMGAPRPGFMGASPIAPGGAGSDALADAGLEDGERGAGSAGFARALDAVGEAVVSGRPGGPRVAAHPLSVPGQMATTAAGPTMALPRGGADAIAYESTPAATGAAGYPVSFTDPGDGGAMAGTPPVARSVAPGGAPLAGPVVSAGVAESTSMATTAYRRAPTSAAETFSGAGGAMFGALPPAALGSPQTRPLAVSAPPERAVALEAGPQAAGASAPDAVWVERASLADAVRQTTPSESAYEAVEALLARWQAEPLTAAEAAGSTLDLPAVAARRGLDYFEFSGNLSALRVLDVPAILELDPGDGTGMHFALVDRVDGQGARVGVGRATIAVSHPTLSEVWFGQAHLLWRDVEKLGSLLARGAEGGRVRRLQELLEEVGVYRGPANASFDEETEDAVVEFQRAVRIAADGKVGPMTMIALYGLTASDRVPHLETESSRQADVVATRLAP